MLRSLLAALLALVLLAPAAVAFPSEERPLVIAYPQEKTPVVVSMGELGLAGELRGGVYLAGNAGTALGPVPTLVVAEMTPTGPRNTTFTGATLEIAAGDLVWAFQDAGSLRVDASTAYGFGLGIPQAPIPAANGAPAGAGFLLASDSITGAARWSGGGVEVAVLNATVTIRGASGQPIAGWDARSVNAGATLSGDGVETIFRVQGAFDARLSTAILAGAAGAGDAAMSVDRAETDNFDAVLASLRETSGALFAGSENPMSMEGGPLDMLGTASALLNGAILLVPGPEGEAAVATRSSVGDEAFDLGEFNMLRGDDLEVRWEDAEMRVQGSPSVALGKNGLAVEPPITVFFLPIISLVLWAIAIGALVWYFVKKPRDAPTQWSFRLGSFAVYLIALLVVFLLWDASFAQTFGTSFVRELRAEGISAETMPQLGVLLALELVPWGIAGLLFALPTRIAAGVALRYLGRGKSFKGLAGAAGIVALGVIGPFYALWAFNLVLQRAMSLMP